MGDVVTKTVLDFLNSGISPPNFHDTHIVLIPKCKEPKRIMDYRPISLCNVVYKIASMSIANRLKSSYPLLLVIPNAFVHNKLITNNVLVAFEVMHHVSQKKVGRTGEMALKLDMSKGYDRVEWACLAKITEKLGFEAKWRELMMKCVNFVTYSMRINGKPKGHIVPSRGLCQGNPLSPHLFLICAKGLSTITKGLMGGVGVIMAPNYLIFSLLMII